MKNKETLVKLVVPGNPPLEREFGKAHAERLLEMGQDLNGGWELPKDSKFIYDEDNGSIRYKADKASTGKTD